MNLTRFFWKFRFLNLAIIVLFCILCCFNISTLNVFFESERIIELSNVDKDIIDKSIDDSNLLLVGIKLIDSISFAKINEVNNLVKEISNSKKIRSIKSILNEKIIINESFIPLVIPLMNFEDESKFNNSVLKLKEYKSNLISDDLKDLIFVIKSKGLDNEIDKIEYISFLEEKFSQITQAKVNISGQIKSEIYMKENIIKELRLFIVLSAILCGLILWYFVRSIKLVIISLFSIFISIIFSFSISNFLFGGIELVMIIIPAIIFIITISDFMHLLNTKEEIKNKYRFYFNQLQNIGKPVFLTSLTTAISFLSFTFGSFEPLMRFGVVTTISIFVCLFIIVTFFALAIDYNLVNRRIGVNLSNKIYCLISLLNPKRSWILYVFIIFSFLGVFNFKVDNFLKDEINTNSQLFKEINYFEESFGGIKPISFSLFNSSNEQTDKYVDFLEMNNVNVDLNIKRNDTTLIKARMKDIGALESNLLYNKIINFSNSIDLNSSIGGVGYLFDQISNKLTYEVLIGLLIAIFLIGFVFVFINNFNFKYLFVSLIPNLIPLFSCLGLLSLFGFYLSLSNAFIFAIVFGLIVDDSIHIISAYSINRRKNKSILDSIRYCEKKTFHAIIKTTIIIIVSLIPLFLSEFRSISQLAYITISAAIIALIFDILYLPNMLRKYIK